jgi:putative glutamine amidotransferase
MNAPLIGVTTSSARATWGSWIDTPAALIPESYANQIVDAGGAPMLLFSGSNPDDFIEKLDGIVLVGGQDVDPRAYGAVPGRWAQSSDPRRDDFECALVVAATLRDLPLLAICRGLQVLNVARGGTLHQHLPDLVNHEGHSPGPGVYGETRVELDQASALARSYAGTTRVVDCYHHQGIERLGEHLIAVGRAEDGVIEAIEDPSQRFMIGVQWHPEVRGDIVLFGSFVNACTARQQG